MTKGDAALYCCADCGQVAEPPRNAGGDIEVIAAESTTVMLDGACGPQLDAIAFDLYGIERGGPACG